MFASCSCNSTSPSLPSLCHWPPLLLLLSMPLANSRTFQNFLPRFFLSFFSGLDRKFYGRALHINESFCLILAEAHDSLCLSLSLLLLACPCGVSFWLLSAPCSCNCCCSRLAKANSSMCKAHREGICRITHTSRSANYLPHQTHQGRPSRLSGHSQKLAASLAS